MRVLFAAAEIAPFAKTGGLADVTAALPPALARLGAEVQLVMPGYPDALAHVSRRGVLAVPVRLAEAPATWLLGTTLPGSGQRLWLVDCPALFARPGGPYRGSDGAEWPDNARRFGHFSRVVAAMAMGGVVADWRPDVVHAHDWHAGPVAALLHAASGGRAARRPGVVFTIHNLAHQGLFPPTVLPELGLPDGMFGIDGLEFHGRVSFLKAGIRFADRVTTVSPSYAREILTPEGGCGLDGLLRHRRGVVSGILNGIDTRQWDPRRDPHLPERYSPRDLAGKRRCKAELQRELGLAQEPGTPLLAFVSRLAHQKAADTVLDALPAILAKGVQFALLGDGDPALEAGFRAAVPRYPGRVAARIGYREDLAHRIIAGADMLLQPSRFEPCGLTQLYALRYGTVPIVHLTGGLRDTVLDADAAAEGNGFGFRGRETDAMRAAIARAEARYGQPLAWRRLQRIGMRQNFDWRRPAERYLALYRHLRPEAAPVPVALPQPRRDRSRVGAAGRGTGTAGAS